MKPDLYLINGPLGAGKTTLLRQLLQNDQFKQARIIENEFASTSIDTQQLHDHHAEVQTIAGVCICCSTGDELIEALNSLAHSAESVIIEATGVANSLKLIEKLVIGNVFERYRLAHGIFVLDATEATDEDLQRYQNELRAADTVLVSKTDLVSAQQLAVLKDKINDTTGSAIQVVREGHFDMELLKQPSQMLAAYLDVEDEITNHDTDTNYSVISTHDSVIAPEVIRTQWLALRDGYGLRRMKGDIIDQASQRWHIEATPAQCRIEQSTATDEQAQLVCIGKNARLLHKDKLIEMLAS